MDAKRINKLTVRTMIVLVILTVVFSISSEANAAPAADENKQPIGDRIRLNFGGWITYPAGEPFHIMHGWQQTSDDEAIGIYDFQLEIDGILQKEDYKDFWAEGGDPDQLFRIWVFNFPEGMAGEHIFTGHWYAPCQTVVDSMDYPGPCPTPNAKVEVSSRELTITFTTEAPPMGLRVNYGHDWVESFYQTGHEVLVTITDQYGYTKASTNVVTDQRADWDGEAGFQSMDSIWFDGDGNEMDSPPDIQPLNFVSAQVDNGASAQVQIGEINGMINFEDNLVTGNINAPWISDEVGVECFPWGAPEPQPDLRYDAIYTDYEDAYQCSWGEEWQINLGQDVGVGYFTPDGHWVANAFFSYARIIASESGDWFWTTDFTEGEDVSIAIYASKDSENPPLWEGSLPAGEGGFINLNYEDHGVDFLPGTYLVISDTSAVKGMVLEPISIHIFNTLDDYMAGTAPFGRDVLVGAGLQDYQDTIWVNADEVIPDDPETGGWFADFTGITDITEDMRWWSWAQIFDEDWDANEGSSPPKPEIRAWLVNNRVEGYQWPLDSEITLYINDFETPLDTQTVTEGDENWTRVEFDLHGWVLAPDQEIRMVGGGTEKFHTVLPVSIADVDIDADIVYGTSSPGAEIILCIWAGGCDPPAVVPDEDEDGVWRKDYGGIFDIQPGFGMDATEFDEDGDGTSYEYWVPWFVLPANEEWKNSEIYLTAGSTLTIEAYGEAKTASFDDFPDAISGPDGQPGTCPNEGNPADCALNDAPYGALVGRIGEIGEPFFIGSYYPFTAVSTGDLYLAVNDNLGYYSDNEGEYLIYIRDWTIAEP